MSSMAFQVVSTVLMAAEQRQQGIDADRLAQFKAQQLEQKAGQERAVAQRKAIAARRRSKFAESRALALAAASGGGASDPTIVNIMSGIAGEGEMAAQSALYEGEERARGAEMGAVASRYEGRQAKRAGYIKAGTSIMSAYGKYNKGSLTTKYAPGDAYAPAYWR